MCSRIRKVFVYFLMKLQGLPWCLGLCTFTAGDMDLILRSHKLCCLAIKKKESNLKSTNLKIKKAGSEMMTVGFTFVPKLKLLFNKGHHG